jgi:hypothetical protein
MEGLKPWLIVSVFASVAVGSSLIEDGPDRCSSLSRAPSWAIVAVYRSDQDLQSRR